MLDDVDTAATEEEVSAVTIKSSALISDLISGKFVTTLSIFNGIFYWYTTKIFIVLWFVNICGFHLNQI